MSDYTLSMYTFCVNMIIILDSSHRRRFLKQDVSEMRCTQESRLAVEDPTQWGPYLLSSNDGNSIVSETLCLNRNLRRFSKQ